MKEVNFSERVTVKLFLDFIKEFSEYDTQLHVDHIRKLGFNVSGNRSINYIGYIKHRVVEIVKRQDKNEMIIYNTSGFGILSLIIKEMYRAITDYELLFDSVKRLVMNFIDDYDGVKDKVDKVFKINHEFNNPCQAHKYFNNMTNGINAIFDNDDYDDCNLMTDLIVLIRSYAKYSGGHNSTTATFDFVSIDRFKELLTDIFARYIVGKEISKTDYSYDYTNSESPDYQAMMYKLRDIVIEIFEYFDIKYEYEKDTNRFFINVK